MSGFVRDAQGRITKITDVNSGEYLYTYDAAGNLLTVKYPGIATPSEYGYEARHLLISEKDQRGHIAGTSSYYADGKLHPVTDAVGNTTEFIYDTALRNTTVKNPDLGTEVTIADAYGSPVSVADPLGRETTYTYDARHNPLIAQIGAQDDEACRMIR